MLFGISLTMLSIFVKHRLLPNGSEQGNLYFLSCFPVDADYPYTIIEKDDDSLPFDETNPYRNVSEKTYEKLKMETLLHSGIWQSGSI